MMISRRRSEGFTLLELVVAMFMAALLALALFTAMHIAIRAKRSAANAVEPTRAAAIAADLIRHDFENVLPPNGILAGPLVGTHQGGGAGSDNDTIDFYSLESDSPASDAPLSEGIRKIELAITNDGGSPALVRRVTRDLLSSTGDASAEQEIIARNVRGFSLRYYDGTNWQTDWDTTTLNVLPVAVLIVVDLNDPGAGNAPSAQPRRATRVVALSCAKPIDTSTSMLGGL
jgi:type II secretion system protein J